MMKKKLRQRSDLAKKQVSFSPSPPTIRLCMRIKEPVWYQEKDFAAFELENRKTISLLTKHELCELDPEAYCIEGLEFRISTSIRRNHRIREKLIRKTILMQQHLQKRRGNDDPERLKEISQLFSKSASYRAQIKAAMFHVLAA